MLLVFCSPASLLALFQIIYPASQLCKSPSILHAIQVKSSSALVRRRNANSSTQKKNKTVFLKKSMEKKKKRTKWEGIPRPPLLVESKCNLFLGKACKYYTIFGPRRFPLFLYRNTQVWQWRFWQHSDYSWFGMMVFSSSSIYMQYIDIISYIALLFIHPFDYKASCEISGTRDSHIKRVSFPPPLHVPNVHADAGTHMAHVTILRKEIAHSSKSWWHNNHATFNSHSSSPSFFPRPLRVLFPHLFFFPHSTLAK